MTTSSQASGRLQGRQLLLARAGWLLLMIAILAVFVASLPSYQKTIETICSPLPGQASGSACSNVSQLTPAAADRLNAIGLSLPGYARYILGLTVAMELIAVVIALLLFWMRSEQTIALFVGLALALIPATDTASALILGTNLRGWRLPAALVNLAGFILLVLLFYLFPSGRFVPSWTRWMILIYSIPGAFTVFVGTFSVFDSPWLNLNLWPGWLQGAYFFSLVITMVYAQVYRYRRISGPVERQQTKWVVFTLVAGMVWTMLFSSLSGIFPRLAEPGSYYLLLVPALNYIPLLLMILVFGIAILRYRLFDIDLIIRRTLVYGALTFSLALVYFGGVVLLQAVLGGIAGKSDSALVTVISTLTIAALFNPLRHRIQDFIDRRFYRRKYNAEQALVQFAAAARDEVDQDNITGTLLKIVEETLQPERMGLWVRGSKR